MCLGVVSKMECLCFIALVLLYILGSVISANHEQPTGPNSIAGEKRKGSNELLPQPICNAGESISSSNTSIVEYTRNDEDIFDNITKIETELKNDVYSQKRFLLGTKHKVNWFQAWKECNYQRMQFASVDSEEEQQVLEKQIYDDGFKGHEFWLSGSDNAVEGQFVWRVTETMVYTNWFAWEPNNGYDANNENCIVIYGLTHRRWSDANCFTNKFYVCQYFE